MIDRECGHYDVAVAYDEAAAEQIRKLLARKRPRLCASTDRAAVQAAGVPVHLAGQAVRSLLQDAAARADIEALRPPTAAEASLLRILDVAIWARHSPSRDARRLRAVGLSIAACA